ncbi:MAG: tetratricopeptide repeat protein [Deltaproteobacteria bacterium]|nr:tetratricopeptide repeat protein [Deltaproteobacteria bacterium]
MPRIKLLVSIALFLTLPLLLSNCVKDNNSLTSTSSDPTAKLAEANDPWKKLKMSRADKEGLPQDRLESLGEIALQSGDYESSLINFMEILKKNPQRYDLHYKVGVIFLIAGQFEAARKELALVLVHQPEMLQAHEALGLVHLQEKKYPLAIEEFQLVLSQEPGRVKSRHLLGVTYLEAGQSAKAVAELKRAVELDRRQVASYIALGQAYTKMKDYPKAIACLKQGLSVDPKNQKLNHQLGMALAGDKRYTEAMDAFLKAGDEAQACNNIGVHYFMAGQYEDAAKCFQRAIELRPTFYDEAKANLQRALEKLHQTHQGGT